MTQKRLRFGIRTQLTFIVLIAALLSTIATLYIANSAIQNYVISQTEQRESLNLQVAWLVLHTEFGDNVSIDVNGNLVADSPLAANGSGIVGNSGINALLPYSLDKDVDFVDEVHHFVGGVVAVYQCANAQGTLLSGGCPRISTDIVETKNGQTVRNLDDKLSDSVLQYVRAHPTSTLVEQDTVSGVQYISAYQAILSPQKDFIGVLFVGEPVSGIQDLIFHITLQLSIVGGLIMIVGAIFAILLAQAITSTLQGAARQVSAASTQFGSIAARQSSGSAQQVWAINALSQALHNLSETATDVARRSDQLAQMGVQILQRRAEISPAQMDAIINYITRFMHDISVQSRQQASTVERMNGAMQAVTEVAQQVAHDGQQTTEGAERLEQVVRQLQRLVGAREVVESTLSKDQASASPRSSSREGAREISGSPGSLVSLSSASPRPLPRSVRPAPGERAPTTSVTWSPLPSQTSNRPTTQAPNTSFISPGQRNQSNADEPTLRPSLIRSPLRRTPSGDVGSFPSFDGEKPFPDNGNPAQSYPPRRDPRGRR